MLANKKGLRIKKQATKNNKKKKNSYSLTPATPLTLRKHPKQQIVR